MSGRSIRLIDKDELLRTLEQDINVSVTGAKNMEAVKRCLQEILDDVRNSPEVDAVPVVRCRECRYNNTIVGYKGESKWCSILERMVKEEDYCSRAERKEE